MSITHFPAVPDSILEMADVLAPIGAKRWSVEHKLALKWRGVEFEVSVDGLDSAEGIVKYRPSVSRRADAVRAALAGEGRIEVTDEDRWRALSAVRIRDRFRIFCEEDGIVDGKKIVDGVTHYYAPDAMGYPTLIMTDEDL